MDKYTTDVLDRLKYVENLIKDMKSGKIDLELFPRLKEPPVERGVIVGVASCCPLQLASSDTAYMNILSILKTEQYRLKKELKDSLDIGENTHWEQD